MSNSWSIPKTFPTPDPPRRYPGLEYRAIGATHASTVSRVISESRYTRSSGWDVKVDRGRVIVRVGDHDVDRICAALSEAKYSYYSFGNGQGTFIFHVRGKYVPESKK